jgi:hypothetical protein
MRRTLLEHELGLAQDRHNAKDLEPMFFIGMSEKFGLHLLAAEAVALNYYVASSSRV